MVGTARAGKVCSLMQLAAVLQSFGCFSPVIGFTLRNGFCFGVKPSWDAAASRGKAVSGRNRNITKRRMPKKMAVSQAGNV